MYRQNNVPAWQRLHQTHDGVRQWNKVREGSERRPETQEEDSIGLQEGNMSRGSAHTYWDKY